MKEATHLHDTARGSGWTMVRSIWRLKIVGILVMCGSIFWLQTYHFQFGMPVADNDDKSNSLAATLAANDDDAYYQDSNIDNNNSNQDVASVVTLTEEDDDDDDDEYYQETKDIAALASPAPTPCPFLSPKITGQKNWKLYPAKDYEGLTLLRDKKESILMTAFPGCVPMVLPKQKLLLFTVLKVSSTVFTQVAKRLDGNPSWPNGCGNVQNPLTTNLTYLTDVSPAYAEQLLLDPDWTKAIFVRDAKERVLSAYLNKAVGETQYIKTRCCAQKSEQVHELLECHDPESLPIISFQEFLTVVVPQCRDGHWCRQSDLLRPVQWQQVNFVGHFDRLQEDSRRLLDDVLGVWEEFGATGWPNGALYAGSSTVHHQTGAHDRLRQYYTRELEDFADEWYKADYDSPFMEMPQYRLYN